MSEIQKFSFPLTGQSVRIVEMNDEPCWVAKDVCDVLGLDNVTAAIRRLDEDEFTTIKLTDSIGREQDTYVITESGLYSLILTSRKLEAKAFKKWVTAEVLPSIRKTGSYSVDTMTPAQRELRRMQIIVELEQKQIAMQIAHDRDISTLTRRIEEVADERHDDGYRTLAAYAKRIGIKPPPSSQDLSSCGKIASDIWRQTYNSEPPTAPSKKFDTVKAYPIAFLDAHRQSIFSKFLIQLG